LIGKIFNEAQNW